MTERFQWQVKHNSNCQEKKEILGYRRLDSPGTYLPSGTAGSGCLHAVLKNLSPLLSSALFFADLILHVASAGISKLIFLPVSPSSIPSQGPGDDSHWSSVGHMSVPSLITGGGCTARRMQCSD